MPQEFYSEGEAEQILRMATRQSVTGGLSRDDLLKTAAEVGLTEAQIAAAEAEFRESHDKTLLTERFRSRQRGRMIQEVLSYLGTNAFLIGIWWMTGHGYFWPGWVLLGMGIHLIEEIPKRLMPSSNAYQRAFAKWRDKGAPELAEETEEKEERPQPRGQVIIGVHNGRRARDRSAD